MKKILALSLLNLSVICILCSCKPKANEELDLNSIHTSASETMPEASETTAPVREVQITNPDLETNTNSNSGQQEGNKKNITASIKSHKSGGISIEYPEVSNMEDTSKQTTVNELLKSNALSVVSAYEADENQDTLSIKCQVISIDRKRVTAIYKGTYSAKDKPYPINLFYTNTVDLSQCKNLELNDYVEANTMAGYVLSDNCDFYDVSSSLKNDLLEYRKTQTIEYFTELFQNADFPYSGTFPESFSYENGGTVYFSIPVPHAMGDYAIIKFVMESK